MTADEARPVGAPVQRGPVFDLPPSPASERDRNRGLVRIVDPAGLSVAWIDPDSARCVEFMVRSGDLGQATWLPVFGVSGVHEMGGAGCEVLVAVADAIPQVTSGALASEWPRSRWQLLQRDPTSVSLRTMLGAEASAGIGEVGASLVAQLEDGTLTLTLTVHNDIEAESLIALGVRAILAPGLEAGSRPVVTGEASGCPVEPRVEQVGGDLAIVFLQAQGGAPLRLLPGAHARLAISIATSPEGAGDE